MALVQKEKGNHDNLTSFRCSEGKSHLAGGVHGTLLAQCFWKTADALSGSHCPPPVVHGASEPQAVG